MQYPLNSSMQTHLTAEVMQPRGKRLKSARLDSKLLRFGLWAAEDPILHCAKSQVISCNIH